MQLIVIHLSIRNVLPRMFCSGSTTAIESLFQGIIRTAPVEFELLVRSTPSPNVNEARTKNLHTHIDTRESPLHLQQLQVLQQQLLYFLHWSFFFLEFAFWLG